jgi:hypothetical protein
MASCDSGVKTNQQTYHPLETFYDSILDELQLPYQRSTLITDHVNPSAPTSHNLGNK